MNIHRSIKMLYVINAVTFILASIAAGWAYETYVLSRQAASIAESAAARATEAATNAEAAASEAKRILKALHDPSLEE